MAEKSKEERKRQYQKQIADMQLVRAAAPTFWLNALSSDRALAARDSQLPRRMLR